MRWLLLTVVLALAGGGLWIVNVSGAHGIVHAVTTPAPASGPGLSSADIGRRQLPGPPTKPGCYRYAPARGWRRVKCDTKQYIRKHIPHPEMISGDAVKLSTPARPFTDTDVMVALRNVGPETDTQHGADNYSIQDNVIFHDSNGQLVAVQFTDQASPFGALEAWFSQVYTQNICVWSVNVTTQNYDSTCLTIASPYISLVKGFTRGNGTLETAVSLGGGAFLAVVATDEYDLEAGHWRNATGTILGYGGGSRAVFAGNVVEATTTVVGSSCMAADPLVLLLGFPPCTTKQKLKPRGFTVYSPGPFTGNSGTEESNNLVPVIGEPPGHLPSVIYPDSWAEEIQYTATTTGSCFTGSPPLCN